MTLRVGDLARALGFWHERFGLPVKLRSGGLVELQSEGVVLCLVKGEPSPGAATIAWEVDDLAAAREELAARGIACEETAVPEGADPAAFGRRLSFRDPDGNRLELVSWS